MHFLHRHFYDINLTSIYYIANYTYKICVVSKAGRLKMVGGNLNPLHIIWHYRCIGLVGKQQVTRFICHISYGIHYVQMSECNIRMCASFQMVLTCKGTTSYCFINDDIKQCSFRVKYRYQIEDHFSSLQIFRFSTIVQIFALW